MTLNSTIMEGIDYCFSQKVDEKSLKIFHDTLKQMNLSESDIHAVMYLFAAACAKHYRNGYMSAKSNKAL